VRVGVHLYRFDSVEPAALRQEVADAARAAEDAGVAWVSVMDHYFQMVAAGFPADDPMLEAYTTLGYLAGVTSEVQLGVLVTGVTYRHPGLLAKIHATLDHGLSNALIESVNTKIRLLTRLAFGFRSAEALIALAMLSLAGHRPVLPGRPDPRISQ